jgi:hypothetical protein
VEIVCVNLRDQRNLRQKITHVPRKFSGLDEWLAPTSKPLTVADAQNLKRERSEHRIAPYNRFTP